MKMAQKNNLIIAPILKMQIIDQIINKIKNTNYNKEIKIIGGKKI
jgi:hypothetical protein